MFCVQLVQGCDCTAGSSERAQGGSREKGRTLRLYSSEDLLDLISDVDPSGRLAHDMLIQRRKRWKGCRGLPAETQAFSTQVRGDVAIVDPDRQVLAGPHALHSTGPRPTIPAKVKLINGVMHRKYSHERDRTTHGHNGHFT